MSTIAKRKPHYVRQPEGGMLLTERDIHGILWNLYRYRFLRSSHLIALTGDSPQVILKRLRRLYDFGCIDRVREPVRFPNGRGSQSKIYTLARPGVEALQRHDVGDQHPITWTRKTNATVTPQISHTLAIAETMVPLEVACRKRDDVDYSDPEDIAEGNDIRWRVNVPGAQHDEIVGVVPDHAFMLHLRAQQKTRHLFLEVDLGSMPVVRTQMKRSSLYKKILAYSQTYKQGILKARFGIETFRVLIVTTSKREHSMILTPHREPLYNREKLVNPPIGKDSPWDKLRLSC